MTILQQVVQTPFARALGWTLLHSLWEGAIVALLLAAALFAIRSPRARYVAACMAMLTVCVAFCLTFSVSMPDRGSGATMLGALPRAPAEGDSFLTGIPSPIRPEDALPWLAPLWMAGVLFFHLRSLASWPGVRRLRHRGVCPAPDVWQQRLAQLRARMQVSEAVALLESGLARMPVVIGYVRPAILVPAGLLAGMPAGQMEAILLHELAHIRRHDYLVNLLQTAAEGFLFYHPAIWWMSHAIRTEREDCCDDLAVSVSGNAYEYATALTALEQIRCDTHAAALAATGGSLVKRIRRLLDRPERSPGVLAPFLSAAILTVAAAGAMAAWQATAPAPAPRAEVSPYTKWLKEDVVYIISDRERIAFERLKSDAEREHFIEQFWLRRDPTPGTPENEFKTEHYRRIAFANERFTSHSGAPGWKTDRGRIYITYGPPDEIESHPGGNQPGRSYAFEVWRYRIIEGIGRNIIVEFADKTGAGDYRMTSDPNPETGHPVRRIERPQ